MKKRFFNAVIASSFLLLAAGGLLLSKGLKRQEVKADGDPEEITLNPTGNFQSNGDKNTIDLECTPETNIPVGWDAGKLDQMSRDAVIINGEYLQDKGGNVVMRKQGSYRYTICIDSVWKFHDIIQDNDIVVVGGQWAMTGFNVTLTPLCVQWSESTSQWSKLDEYDIGAVNLKIKDSRKTDPTQLYLDATGSENFLPADGGWGMRMKQGSNDAFIFNGDETKPVTGHKVELMKVRYDMYLVYIPDTGSPYNSVSAGDTIVIQGIYVYQYSPRFVTHLHVAPITVTWDGTQWVDGAQYYASQFLGTALCNGGVDSPSNSLWTSLGTSFGHLGSDASNAFKNATYTKNGDTITPGDGVSQNLAEAAARYDYIVRKYGSAAYNDFANRFNGEVVPPNSVKDSLSNTSRNSSLVIIVVSITSTLTLLSCGLILIKRRKHSFRNK